MLIRNAHGQTESGQANGVAQRGLRALTFSIFTRHPTFNRHFGLDAPHSQPRHLDHRLSLEPYSNTLQAVRHARLRYRNSLVHNTRAAIPPLPG
jgi:hypothetical protein